MINMDNIAKIFDSIKGKTIAIVYIFEGDVSSGFNHFFIWKSNILTKWLNAIQELHCIPLILDVRTFVDKAINKTLPHIDFVLNMNSGTYDLSSMALVPSTCSSIGVPCIPCDAVTIVTGENKLLSTLIAKSSGLNVPEFLDSNDPTGIFRPINLGNSMGVTRGINSDYKKGLYQRFIKGYDITTPVVYNSYTQKMDVLPTIMYIPENNDLNWFNGEKEKKSRTGYKFKIVDLDTQTKKQFLSFVDIMSVKTFCRIDARVNCSEIGYYHKKENKYIEFKDVNFVEINVMPTIRDNNNFDISFKSIDSSSSFFPCILAQKKIFENINIHSFLLASSILANTTCI